MPTLRFRFAVRLESYWVPSVERINGPLFNSYVPNGREDAITVGPDADPHEVRLWFERRAKKNGGLLEWAHDGKEFDEETMRRQAKLDAGPMYGELIMPDTTDEEFACLLVGAKAVGEKFGTGIIENPTYVAYAKRVIDQVQPPVSRFIATLRAQYGQYWLRELTPWDSRSTTLGTYCNSALGLRWWHTEKDAWYWLLPTDSGATIRMEVGPGRGYAEYLTEHDWTDLKASRYVADVTTEVQLAGNASRALDAGDLRQAFVETIAALEIAVGRKLSSSSKIIRPAIQSFQDRETQRAQVAVVMLALGRQEKEIEGALEALALRNRIVHEAYQPTLEDTKGLRDVLRTIGKISGVGEIKSPVLTNGNMLSAPP